jgi:GTPase involved in cell partitioning and DNA repair
VPAARRPPGAALGSAGQPAGPGRRAAGGGAAGGWSGAGATVTLQLDDGLESLVHQIVEAALDVDGGSKIAAAARLHISARTVQRYVASGRVLADRK